MKAVKYVHISLSAVVSSYFLDNEPYASVVTELICEQRIINIIIRGWNYDMDIPMTYNADTLIW